MPTSRTSPRGPIVHVALAVDTISRRVVGWSVATDKRTDLVRSAFEMGLWQRDRTQHPVRRGESVHHSDAGSQLGFKGSLQHARDLRRVPGRP